MIAVSEKWNEAVKNATLKVRAELTTAAGIRYYLDYGAESSTSASAVVGEAKVGEAKVGDDGSATSGSNYYDYSIMEMTFEEATSQESSFDVGQAVMSTLEFKLNNDQKRFYSIGLGQAEIIPYVGVEHEDGTTEWVQKGVYTIERPDRCNSVISVTAYDNMQKMEEPFASAGITFPATFATIVSNMCSYCGVTLASPSFPNSAYSVSSLEDNNYSCRQILSYICQIAGCYARMNNEGKLTIGWYKSAAALSSGNYHEVDTYTSLETEEDDYQIDGVKVISMSNPDAEGEDSTEEKLIGDDGFTIQISENPLVPYGEASRAATALFAIVGTTFRPATLSTFWNPAMEAGDTIITSDDDDSYEFFATSISVTVGSTATIKCAAESGSDNAAAQYTGSSQAILSVLDAVRANIKNLTAGYAKIDFANVDTLEVVDAFVKNLLTAQSFIVESETAVDLSVTGYLSGVNIYADVIQAGTLSTERLLLVGEDSVVYEINAQSSGLTATQLTDEVYQNYINGTVIVANSITANQIAAATITSNEIMARSITSESIEAGAITSVEIAAGAVTADKIDVADLYAIQATIGGWGISKTAIYHTEANTGDLDPDDYGNASGLARIMSSGYTGTYIGLDGILQYNNAKQYILLQDGMLTAYGATLAGMLTLSGTSEYIRGDSDLWLAPGGNTPNSEGVTAAYDWWRNSYEEGHEDNVVTSGDLIIGGTSTARELVVLGYPTISDATNKTNVVGLGVAVNEYNYGLYDYTNNRWMLRSEYGTDEVKVDIAFRVNSAVYAGSVETDGGLTVGGTLKMPNSANTSTSYPLLEIADSGTVGYLTADIGSSDTPVYINGGKLVASKYDLSTLAKASDIPDLSGYVTLGGLSDELAGYATQSWVQQQGYATQSWVQQQGYTTQSWVQSQGYLTSSSIDLSDYAKTSDLKKYLPLTGGTVTGKITSTGGGFYSTASDQTEAFYHKHPDTNYEVQIGVGGGGYNRGVYIPSTGEWLICRHTFANSSSSTGYSYYNVISGKLYYRDGNSASGDDGTIDEGSIHSSAIGSYKYTYVTGTSLSSGTYKAVRSVSLDAGVWIIRGNVYFPTSSASGYAAVNISGTSGSSTYNNDTCSFVYMTGTHFANLHVTRFVSISSSTTYYLNAGQDTGSSKSVNAYMQALRIL